MTTTAPARLAGGHDQLLAELAILDLLLEREVVRLRDSGLYVDSDFRGLYVADEQVDRLLDGGPSAAVRPRSGRDLQLTQAIADSRDALEAVEAAARDAGAELPLTGLQRRFGLDGAERRLLVIALACEVDLRYEHLFAYAHNDVTRKRPTVDLAARLLADDLEGRARVRGLLAPGAPLLRHRLLAADERDRSPLATRTLEADRRVADFVLGVDALDERLAPFTRWLARAPARRDAAGTGGAAGAVGVPDLLLPPTAADALPGLLASLRERGDGVVLLHGAYGSGRSRLAAAVAAELGRPLLVADMRAAVQNEECCMGTVLSLLAREARLTGAAVLLERFDALFDDPARAELRAHALGARLAGCGAPVLLSAREGWHPPPPWPDVPFTALALSPTPYRVRVEAWRRALARAELAADADAAELAGKFGLSPGQVRDAVREATAAATRRPPGARRLTGDDLHAAARAQSAHELGRFARRIQPRRSWDDLVVSRRVLRQLHEIERHVRHRAAVRSAWGFDVRLSMGAGINVLFSGPSGTGKTLAAEILAHELRLELFKVDLSAVISKYIGETEKQLEALFRSARDSNAIVFFDEADATFGKRSEVGDAHDRYANIEVAYLLQQVEEYDGVVILATNLRRNIDDAFARRMQHTVEFAPPRAAERRRILDLLLPPGAPLAADVDLDFLAERFELSGGNLRNVAVAAAYLAADEGTAVTMRHLVLATARELEKTGRLPSRSDFGPHFAVLHDIAAASGRA